MFNAVTTIINVFHFYVLISQNLYFSWTNTKKKTAAVQQMIV